MAYNRSLASNNKMKGTLEEQFPGWPDAYMLRVYATVFDGISSDYPLLILATDYTPYLLPSSEFCSCSHYEMSKSQRSKTEGRSFAKTGFDAGASLGSKVTIVVSRNKDDPLVKCMLRESRNPESPLLQFDGALAEVLCVFSHEKTPRCYVPGFGLVHFDTHQKLAAGWIPNVVYEGRMACCADYRKVNGVIKDLTCKLTIVKICGLASPKRHDYERAITGPPWAGSLPTFLTNIRHFDQPTDLDELYGKDKKMVVYREKPTPPPSRLYRVKLWYFEGDRVVRARWPITRVRIMSPSTSMVPNLGDKDLNECEIKHISEGMQLTATILYNKMEKFYVVENYYIEENYAPLGAPKENYQLPKRVFLDKKSGYTEKFQYQVAVHHSLLNDFFVCDQLDYALIFDPKRLLRNADPMEHPSGFPVWIQLEPDEWRLSQFSIVSLEKMKTIYTKKERSAEHQDIYGHGILIDESTGTVYSLDHPQTLIRLSPDDQKHITFGQKFHFVASFYGLKRGFIVCGIQLMGEDDDDGEDKLVAECTFETTQMEDGTNVFKVSLIPLLRQWATDGHYSDVFGPVGDPGQMLRAYLHREVVDWPVKFTALIGPNREWEPGKDTQLRVYGVLMPKDGKEGAELTLHKGENRRIEPEEEAEASPSSSAAVEQPQQQQEQMPQCSTSASTSSSSDEADHDDDNHWLLHAWGLLKEIGQDPAAGDLLEPELMQEVLETVDELRYLGTGEKY